MSMLGQLFGEREVPLKVTAPSFGPLGPAFRGRDRVDSFTVWPSRAVRVISNFYGADPFTYNTSRQRAAFGGWSDGSDPGIRWMLDLHRRADRIQPMTVRSPSVTITCAPTWRTSGSEPN